MSATGSDPTAWLDTCESGLQPASLPFLTVSGSFVSGDPAGQRLRVRYYQREEDGSLLAKVWFGPQAQGPPGHAHGGSMAAILDEAMGGAAWLAGYPVVAVQLTLDLKGFLPLGIPCLVTARVTAAKGRKIHTEGLLHAAQDERVFCRGSGIFVVLEPDHLRQMPAAAAEMVRRAMRDRHDPDV